MPHLEGTPASIGGKKGFYGPRGAVSYHSIEGHRLPLPLAVHDDTSSSIRVRGGADAARELVGDRAGVVGVLLEEDAIPDERDGCSGRQLAVERDREGVH